MCEQLNVAAFLCHSWAPRCLLSLCISNSTGAATERCMIPNLFHFRHSRYPSVFLVCDVTPASSDSCFWNPLETTNCDITPASSDPCFWNPLETTNCDITPASSDPCFWNPLDTANCDITHAGGLNDFRFRIHGLNCLLFVTFLWYAITI